MRTQQKRALRKCIITIVMVILALIPPFYTFKGKPFEELLLTFSILSIGVFTTWYKFINHLIRNNGR